MKKLTKILSLMLALTMLLSFPVAVSAAELEDAPIDESKTGSLTIYKYDLTNAEKDGVWDSSYVSTGVFDQSGVNDVLGGGNSTLGNGETGYGYAIKGVEFSYVLVADIVQFSESENDSRTDSHVEVLYAIDKTKGEDFLKALNLADGKNRYTNADALDSTKYYYQSDVLIDALAAALESNSTVVKNALEAYIAANGGAAMPLTDAYGKTKAENLNLGLYLVVETKVPEMVVSTTDPFLVSVPMTSVNGTNATDGGTRWIYDITLYPKNLTGIPSLEKTLRENKNDTGKNNGTATITDGFAHTGTASAGDTIDYQIISTLPSITSESTYLSCYTFVDTLSKGLTYNKGDVVLEFFTDAACTDSVAMWTEADGKFTVAYNTTDAGESVMTIEMTADGLKEINTSKAVYSGASMVNSGYSDCTVRITYAAKMDSSNDLVFGDKGNDNKVVLTWKRSSQNYYDTLVDDCHVFSYGIDLTKLFSDGKGDFSKVEFLIQNKTDNYFVKAELNKDEGIYYVVDHVTDKADATHFVPVKTADAQGRIIVKGLEDDTYTLTEVRTDSGYVMLKQGIDVAISRKDTDASCGIYGADVLGLIQNDPRYASIIKDNGDLHNMPQKHLEHKLLTASATVDGKKVNMVEDNGSINAEAPLTVVNTSGFDLPQTGDHGTWMFTVGGIVLMASAMVMIFIACRKKSNR
ncbi:MAG: SpaH/EbpB family LPXTG-anchored major pilin [Firmicutes bacterium]|nr:SpaH/EbpB family LPXTG-anchored major pilin [Bacillota bacterium]